MKALILTLAITAFAPAFSISSARADDAPKVSEYAINQDDVTKTLLATWYGMALDKNCSEKDRKYLARDLYCLIFECWLVTEHQHKKMFVAINGVKNIYNLAQKYEDIRDPLALDALYEGDKLGPDGNSRASSFPLIDSNTIFASKQRYHSLVDQFLEWETTQIKLLPTYPTSRKEL